MKILTIALLLLSAMSAFSLDVPLNKLTVRIFSAPSYCGSCRNLESHLEKTGQKRFLRINKNGKRTIMIVEFYNPDDLTESEYTKLGYSGEGVPEYVVVKRDNSVVARDSGYAEGLDFTKEILSLLNQN